MRSTDFLEKPAQKVKHLDKKKRHGKGFSEDVKDKRAARISFKKYIQEVKEQELFDLADNHDEDLE